MIESGEAVVFALGDDASIDAVVARAQELGIGQVMTFTLDEGSEALVREAAEHLPEMPPLTSHPLLYSSDHLRGFGGVGRRGARSPATHSLDD